MARTALAVQQIVDEGLAPTLTAANADGHSIQNNGNGKAFAEVVNGGGASINVTAQTPATANGVPIADQVVAVPAGGRRFIGPWEGYPYNQSDGTVYLDFSSVTSVTVGAFLV